MGRYEVNRVVARAWSLLAVAVSAAVVAAAVAAARAEALALDPSYGDAGIAAVELGPGARPGGIAAAGDALVLAGTVDDSSGGDAIAVARLDSDGAPDPAFGTGGVVATGVAGSADSVVVQADGRIVVAGSDAGDVVVIRLLAGGTPDPDFGTAGLVRFDFGPAAAAHGTVDVGLDSLGRIVVTGSAPAPDPADLSDVYAARLDAAGELDPGFGGDGIANAGAASGSDDEAADAAVLENDSVCAVGHAAGIGDEIYCFATDGSVLPGLPALGVYNVYEAVAALPGGGYLPVGTASDQAASRSFWFSPSHHDLNFAEPVTGLRARARAVELLDADFAVVAGGTNVGAGSPVVPAFVLISTYPDTASLAKWKFPGEAAFSGTAVDLATDSRSRALALLDLDADGSAAVSVARVSPALFDPPDPPVETGRLRLGELRVPPTIAGLVRRGASVRASCNLTCDLRLRLEVPKRVARRFDLPGTRLAGYRDRLAAGSKTRARFVPTGRVARRLRRIDGAPAKLHPRVVRAGVAFQPA